MKSLITIIETDASPAELRDILRDLRGGGRNILINQPDPALPPITQMSERTIAPVPAPGRLKRPKRQWSNEEIEAHRQRMRAAWARRRQNDQRRIDELATRQQLDLSPAKPVKIAAPAQTPAPTVPATARGRIAALLNSDHLAPMEESRPRAKLCRACGDDWPDGQERCPKCYSFVWTDGQPLPSA